MTTEREPAVDAERPIVDAHHHMWAARPGRPQYLMPELVADGAAHNVTHTVFVECSWGYRTAGPVHLRPVGETEFMIEQARESDAGRTRIAALVGYADLALGDGVDEVLEAHEDAGRGLFRGVRHRGVWAPDLGVHAGDRALAEAFGSDGFRRGVARLGRRDLSLDVWAYLPQLPRVADLARAVPQTQIVLDHLGAPLHIGSGRDRDEVREAWHTAMREIAECANVSVKLGGIGMDDLYDMGWEAGGSSPDSDEIARCWGDHIRWCIDVFGPTRCMFESNTPVDTKWVAYGTIWNAFQKIAAEYTNAEQDALFVETARRTYRF